MKKFLFTLAALMMAGSLSAEEYMYIPDFEVAQDQLGSTIELYVPAHYDAAVSAWEVWIDMPEGMEITYAEQGEDMTITYNKANGRTGTLTAPFYFQGPGHYITAVADPGYYQVDGAWVSYGCVKWLAGDYEEMIYLEVEVAANFAGGEITVTTEPSCGQDSRPEVERCVAGQHNVKTCVVTVEGGVVVPQDFAGQIVFGDVTEDGLLPVSYNGEEEYTITITLNGEPVELVDGCVQLIEGNNIVTVTISAEGYNDMTATYEGEWTAPEPPTPEQTATPTITVVDDPEAQTVTVTATGDGHIIIYWDDMPQAEGEGTAVWVIPYGDDPEGEEYGVSATAQEEGKEVSEYALETVFVPGKPTTPEPPTPTHPGYWLVMVQADGTEEYVELNLGANGDYITAYDVIWPLYVNVGNFYFVIDDVAYGAEADGTEAYLGDAMMNPLSADNNNTYYVYNGYSYSIGIHLVINEETMEVVGYTAYVAKGGPVSVDELVNGKTVAGVRYYNMAGQEMQEANGMTIVVTTYTDGTTSSVKVMK